MTRTHEINGQEVSIEWEQDELIENHGSGCCYYGMNGIGSDGKEYIATGIYQGDDLEDIEDVEEA